MYLQNIIFKSTGMIKFGRYSTNMEKYIFLENKYQFDNFANTKKLQIAYDNWHNKLITHKI